MTDTEADVVVVGAGPVGLWLAGELRLAGVATTVLERTSERGPFTRGLGVHARTVEVLAMRGAADVPLERGRKRPRWHWGMLTTPVDFSVLDTPFPFVLGFPQPMLEDLLERRAAELGAVIRRGCTVTGVSQDGHGVRVTADGGQVFTARYVVGCDGTRSVVRQAAGIEFPGTDSELYGYLGDATLDNPPEQGTVAIAGPGGTLIIAPLPGGRFRVAGFDPAFQEPGSTLTEEQLRASVRAATGGRDFGLHDATWRSRFGNATRQAARYRAGRVLVAGDAAHMHLPTGGVGLNVGVQDAMNLGWKLAAVVQGRAGDELLDSYQAERHPVGQTLLTDTRAQTALITTFTPEGLALREVMAGLLARDPALGTELATRMSGLAVSYPPPNPGAHELTGQRVPDLAAGGTSLFQLLRTARPVLLVFAGGAILDEAVRVAQSLGIETHQAGLWPGHEKVSAALVRPDGYLWWATDQPVGDGAAGALRSLGVRFA